LLDRQFHGPLRSAIERALADAELTIDAATRNDTWQSAPVFVLDTVLAPTIGADGELRRGATLQLSESGRDLYGVMQRLLRGTTRIATLELTPTLASGFERFLTRYALELTRSLHNGRLNATASLAALTNLANIVGELVPRIVEVHQRALGDVPLRSMEEMAVRRVCHFFKLTDACMRLTLLTVSSKMQESVERHYDEFVALFGDRRAEDIVHRK
jgi:hypothetical protein